MSNCLRTFFAYDDWANREALGNLIALPSPPKRAVELMCHIVSAQRLWWRRIHNQPLDMPVWPALTLDQCGVQLEGLHVQWRQLIENLTPALARKSISYTNSLGEPWQNTVEDVLRHVCMHGSYHRGQIATHLRLAGVTPAYTDYIHAVRRGFIE